MDGEGNLSTLFNGWKSRHSFLLIWNIYLSWFHMLYWNCTCSHSGTDVTGLGASGGLAIVVGCKHCPWMAPSTGFILHSSGMPHACQPWSWYCHVTVVLLMWWLLWPYQHRFPALSSQIDCFRATTYVHLVIGLTTELCVRHEQSSVELQSDYQTIRISIWNFWLRLYHITWNSTWLPPYSLW